MNTPSAIIRRTNPDPIKGTMGGTIFKCTVCGSKYNNFDEGKACAEADFTRRDREVANAKRRARRASKLKGDF